MKTRKNILYAREIQPAHERLAADAPFGYIRGKENIAFVSRLVCGYSNYFSANGGLQIENDSAFCVQNATVGRVYALAVTWEVYKAIHNPENYPAFIKDSIKKVEAEKRIWEHTSLQESTYTARQYQYELKRSDFEVLGVVEQANSMACVTLNERFANTELAKNFIDEVERAFFEDEISIVKANEPLLNAVGKDSPLAAEGLFGGKRKVSMHASGCLQASGSPLCIGDGEEERVRHAF